MEEPVRSQARLDQTKRLSNAILRRTVVNVVSVIIALPITLFFVHVFGMNGVSFTVIVAYGVGALVMALYLLALVRRGLREESR